MKNISNTLIIPSGSTERFLSFEHKAAVRYSHGTFCGGISRVIAGYKVVFREHSAHELIYVLDGEFTFRFFKSSVQAVKGDCVFLPAGMTPHEYAASSPSAAILWLHYHSTQTHEVLAPESIPEKPFCRRGIFFEEMRLLAELLYLQEQHGDSAMSSTGSMIKNYFSGELLEQKKSSGSLQSKLQTIFKSVEENLSRQYTVAALARKAGLSESHFFAAVNRFYGASPLEIIRRMRMRKGALLLKRTDLKLDSIARAVGYTSGCTFSKAFRKDMKISPGQYRDQN